MFNCTEFNENKIRYWLRQIKATSNQSIPPIIIVGTHNDNPICTKLFLDKLSRDIETLFPVKQWNIVSIHYTSRMTFSGVKALVKSIKHTAITQKLISQHVPETYVMVDRLLTFEKSQINNQTISWENYCKIIVSCSINESEINNVTNFLKGKTDHYTFFPFST